MKIENDPQNEGENEESSIVNIKIINFKIIDDVIDGLTQYHSYKWSNWIDFFTKIDVYNTYDLYDVLMTSYWNLLKWTSKWRGKQGDINCEYEDPQF